MRVDAPGVRLFAVRVHDSTDSIFRTLQRALGARCLIALLRVAAVAVTVPLLIAVARAMWALPAAGDAVIAGSAAVAWTVWLDGQGEQ